MKRCGELFEVLISVQNMMLAKQDLGFGGGKRKSGMNGGSLILNALEEERLPP